MKLELAKLTYSFKLWHKTQLSQVIFSVKFPYNPIHKLCMHALLFLFRRSIISAYVSVVKAYT